MKIEGVETALGNKIIDFLRAQRWRKIDEYSSLHVDKGIDFDSYIFESENGLSTSSGQTGTSGPYRVMKNA